MHILYIYIYIYIYIYKSRIFTSTNYKTNNKTISIKNNTEYLKLWTKPNTELK